MSENLEPNLAPPGAGLPAPELFAARLRFAWRRWTGTRAEFSAKFNAERAAVRALVDSCDAGTAARRVLIKRVRGLEDSSRYWSVWMTLDHLRIMHHRLAGIVNALTHGVVPKTVGSTAAVKPSADVTAAVVAEYEESCDVLVATVGNAPDLQTRARYTHPWFGPLDAAGWHALAGGHLAIHRLQIERILAGLGPSTPARAFP